MNSKIDPLHQVFQYKAKSHSVIKKNAQTLFQSPFTLQEREQIIELYKEKNRTNLFNGKSIRLDKIENIGSKTFIELSMIEFYDFISTTMIYNQRDSFIQFCKENHKGHELELIERLCDSTQNKEKSFENVINTNVLSNILAVSILIEDRNGAVGLLKRSNKVAISSGIFSVTSTGSLDEQDFSADNPFISCAKRELKEELNIDTESLMFEGLVMSKKKLQPIALLSVKLEKSWRELIADIKSAKDFNKETQEFYAVPLSILPHFLYTESFTDAALYQIYKKIMNNGIDMNEFSLLDFDKKRYLI